MKIIWFCLISITLAYKASQRVMLKRFITIHFSISVYLDLKSCKAAKVILSKKKGGGGEGGFRLFLQTPRSNPAQ